MVDLDEIVGETIAGAMRINFGRNSFSRPSS
jgi:hypothetical protein